MLHNRSVSLVVRSKKQFYLINAERKFLEGYHIAQRITSKFGKSTCKMNGWEWKGARQLKLKFIPEKNWWGCQGCRHWTLYATTRATRMNPKPSVLLCITSCRLKDLSRSFQLAGSGHVLYSGCQGANWVYLTFQHSCWKAKSCLPWNSHHGKLPKRFLVALKEQLRTTDRVTEGSAGLDIQDGSLTCLLVDASCQLGLKRRAPACSLSM